MRGMDTQRGLPHSRLSNGSRDHQRRGLTFAALKPGV
jgi:hypothetical protein